ncbi:MAG: hypothetical protein JO030_08155 [Candidatus Eremiobacteraeota bacterium]|nr:hypothetical protein [Candidatus Eremiobacteraeota bacterium]
MPYNVAGSVLAAAVAALAWHRSRVTGGFYDAHGYGMTPATHRAYALVSLAFAACFAAFAALHRATDGIATLALFAVVAIFYGASFLQGARDPDE